MNEAIPKYGDIGICQNGFIGLVLDTIDDTSFGIHLGRLKLGMKWQSNKPKIIGNVYDYIAGLEYEENKKTRTTKS